MTTTPLSSVSLHHDYDIVAARRRARQVAEILGFDNQEQTRIATVASEIVRNALRYAGGGRLELGVDSHEGRQSLVMTVSDSGKGIANLDDVLRGTYRSETGMGIGINGARKLMDDFSIDSGTRGTTVVMKKALPPGAPPLTPRAIESLADELSRTRSDSPFEEIQQQNAELLQALASLNERQEDLQRLNQELEDTNRGVLALYAELDEKAEHLRRADQLKSRFLSDMSHEFRTPVNSILALTRLLAEEQISDEAHKQVALIRRAAEDLATLVSDLLDLAKIEAGKIDVHVGEFEVTTLFSALRGMLRPLLLNRSLALVLEEPEGLPPMLTDEGKVSQILRNFISNALKFTEAGEVRVSAQLTSAAGSILFSVADTGIGIGEDDQERIFDEFTQVDNPMQRQHKGSGLGLPLTRKLAQLLGGKVWVESQAGVGSTFYAEIPVRYRGVAAPKAPVLPASANLRVLVIDDDETARYTIGSFAGRPGSVVLEADSGLEGIARAKSERPDVILLDLMMPGVGGHEVLQRLKDDPATEPIPVIVVTSRFINDDEKAQILSRAVAVINKADLSREVVSRTIEGAVKR